MTTPETAIFVGITMLPFAAWSARQLWVRGARLQTVAIAPLCGLLIVGAVFLAGWVEAGHPERKQLMVLVGVLSMVPLAAVVLGSERWLIDHTGGRRRDGCVRQFQGGAPIERFALSPTAARQHRAGVGEISGGRPREEPGLPSD